MDSTSPSSRMLRVRKTSKLGVEQVWGDGDGRLPWGERQISRQRFCVSARLLPIFSFRFRLCLRQHSLLVTRGLTSRYSSEEIEGLTAKVLILLRLTSRSLSTVNG